MGFGSVGMAPGWVHGQETISTDGDRGGMVFVSDLGVLFMV